MRCDVIIPVGPGHEETCKIAAGSVATAAKYSQGPFEQVQVALHDDTEGKRGRSATRNAAVEKSDADWVFFLDADDLMHPSGFKNAPALLEYSEQAPVAIWGTIVEYRDGCLYERYQVPEIDTYPQLLQHEPTQTLQMGHFVRRDIAIKYPFNTAMDVGEDWEYYLRIWQAEDCKKIAKPFMINRRGMHSTGPRSATGADWNQAVNVLIDGAIAEYEDTDNRQQGHAGHTTDEGIAEAQA